MAEEIVEGLVPDKDAQGSSFQVRNGAEHLNPAVRAVVHLNEPQRTIFDFERAEIPFLAHLPAALEKEAKLRDSLLRLTVFGRVKLENLVLNGLQIFKTTNGLDIAIDHLDGLGVVDGSRNIFCLRLNQIPGRRLARRRSCRRSLVFLGYVVLGHKRTRDRQTEKCENQSEEYGPGNPERPRFRGNQHYLILSSLVITSLLIGTTRSAQSAPPPSAVVHHADSGVAWWPACTS